MYVGYGFSYSGILPTSGYYYIDMILKIKNNKINIQIGLCKIYNLLCVK